MKHTTIAVDLAKSVFEVAVSRRAGKVAERHRLSRGQFARFLAERAPATVVKRARGNFSLQELRETFRSVGDNLAEILGSFGTITLPLLGTGYQRIEPRSVVRELLSVLPRWAEYPQLRTVRVFSLQLEHVALLNRALDDREFAAEESSILSAASEELRRRVGEDWDEATHAVLKELLQIATASDPSARSIALQGRRVAEAVIRRLTREEIDQEGAAPWSPVAEHQLGLLRDYAAVATRGEPITNRDAAMVLLCAMGTAEFMRR